MAGGIQFILNGRAVRIQNCSPNTTLLKLPQRIGAARMKEGSLGLEFGGEFLTESIYVRTVF